ncbi:hypothetical protein ACSSV4_004677 [Roseovarius sp. MBR-154]|jgi:hypothetical protein
MEHIDADLILTENERAWLDFLRIIAMGHEPGITPRRVRLLRRICEARRA